MLRVGLTGGIGSGKSTVAQLFAAYNVPLIDADHIAHDLVKPGSAALAAIIKHFGKQFLTANGELNRTILRQHIFNQPKEKQWLENYLHPLIRAQMTTLMAKLSAPYCIVSIPLLVETWPHPLIDRVLVVDVDEATQLQRVITRDHLTDSEVRAIMSQQATRATRLKLANDIITNTKNMADLREQVAHLHDYYQQLAKASA